MEQAILGATLQDQRLPGFPAYQREQGPYASVRHNSTYVPRHTHTNVRTHIYLCLCALCGWLPLSVCECVLYCTVRHEDILTALGAPRPNMPHLDSNLRRQKHGQPSPPPSRPPLPKTSLPSTTHTTHSPQLSLPLSSLFISTLSYNSPLLCPYPYPESFPIHTSHLPFPLVSFLPVI
jgi:hypothetical protein